MGGYYPHPPPPVGGGRRGAGDWQAAMRGRMEARGAEMGLPRRESAGTGAEYGDVKDRSESDIAKLHGIVAEMAAYLHPWPPCRIRQCPHVFARQHAGGPGLLEVPKVTRIHTILPPTRHNTARPRPPP